jgi:hypothetical protein
MPARANDSYRARVNAVGVCPNTDSTRREAVFCPLLSAVVGGRWGRNADCLGARRSFDAANTRKMLSVAATLRSTIGGCTSRAPHDGSIQVAPNGVSGEC